MRIKVSKTNVSQIIFDTDIAAIIFYEDLVYSSIIINGMRTSASSVIRPYRIEYIDSDDNAQIYKNITKSNKEYEG